MTLNARLFSALVMLTALAGIVVQFIVSYRLTGGVGATVWALGGYFTVLTNALVLATYAVMTVKGQMLSARWLAGLTLWIAIVGVIYHLLLAGLWQPEGLALWADQLLHTASPVLAVLFWVVCAPKSPLPWISAVRWLSWPLIYVIYAMFRGMFTGFFPYPFIDLNVLTPGQVAMNSIGLSIAFWIGGMVMIAIARALDR